jgi:hypothetical protein
MNRFKYDDLSMLGACRSSVKAALGPGLLPCGCQDRDRIDDKTRTVYVLDIDHRRDAYCS